jgi:hypothetical protein
LVICQCIYVIWIALCDLIPQHTNRENNNGASYSVILVLLEVDKHGMLFLFLFRAGS